MIDDDDSLDSWSIFPDDDTLTLTYFLPDPVLMIGLLTTGWTI